MEQISTRVSNSVCTKEKLSELIDTYDKLVFSVCYKLTGDYFASEDLMQETFLSVFQKYDTFDGVNEKAWICRIAANKSIDYLRSAGLRSVPTEDIFFEAVVEQRGSPEDICIEQEVKSRLLEKCKGLRPPYDRVAEDHYIRELSAREIAEKRGQSIKTVQTQIYRAREMLKKIYGKEEPA